MSAQTQTKSTDDDFIVIEKTLNAPVAVVWKALTDPKQMRKWYFSSITDFKAEVGFKTRADVEHEGQIFPHLWEVSEVIKEKKLSYHWQYAGYEGDSLLTFELTPQGDKTLLKLTHTGLMSFNPERFPMMSKSNFTKGWTDRKSVV